uniref:ankyrin repeat and death domain-containing protein 1A-like n=1 Tax=Myxine glutinosa TaxID=7769 RepID=UPI00358FCDBD
MDDDLASDDDLLLKSEKDLHDSARRNDLNRITELLRKGVDVNAKSYTNRTALHLAAGKGQEAAVKLLLNHHAVVDDEDKNFVHFE